MLREVAMKFANMSSRTVFISTNAASSACPRLSPPAALSSARRWVSPLHHHGFASLDLADTRTPSFATQTAAVMHEVDWEVNRANSVSIIGNLGKNPEPKVLPSGKTVTSMTLACKRGKDATAVTDWYDVDAWDEVGSMAVEHLYKGSKVLVEGRLRQDQWTDKLTGQQRTRTKIVATNLAKVRSGFSDAVGQGSGTQNEWSQEGGQQPLPGGEWLSGDQTQGAFEDGPIAQPQQPAFSQDKYTAAWELFFSDRDAFWDNRDTKRGKQPDFKNKATGEGLWVDSAPPWAKTQLDSPSEVPF